MEHVHTFGFSGTQKISLIIVRYGVEKAILLVSIHECSMSKSENPFTIFSKQERNYPFICVEITVAGACFRPSVKGQRMRAKIIQWENEGCNLCHLRHGCHCIIFVDNCGGHSLTDVL